jgi:trimethylamine--corrinoid protein Co-methyltransferase
MVETMEGINGGQFKLLTKSQIHQIHQNTLKILEDPGIVVDEPTALKIFDNAGAEVDLKQQRVKISEELVDEAIKKAPKGFIVYARDRSNNLKIGGNRVYFSPTSTHPFIFDLDTGERRSTVFSDCEKLVRLNDCLEMVHGNVCPVHPTDVPERVAHAYIMLASASNTSKIFRGRNYGRQIAKAPTT